MSQEGATSDRFIWKKDTATGADLAASRKESPFNFFDVGDLSYYSQYLVENDLRRMAVAAGVVIDHTPATHSSLLIVHDTRVFERLKSDKPAFRGLGFSDEMIASLERQVTLDTPKCLTMTVTDGENNVTGSIILLSEKYDACLVGALLSYFGIAASDLGLGPLVDLCVLYEGRRLGLRDRESLGREFNRLRNACLTKLANTN